ncbi:hypothetical protein [Seinonella peptonophila]|uniref:hypothetical protein n=1 Tax=Seinonella peptonophila TaxID=112248 RepID=UPI001587762F|nr:hypothetical protein [Seinonella peptonophila]
MRSVILRGWVKLASSNVRLRRLDTFAEEKMPPQLSFRSCARNGALPIKTATCS